MEYMGDSDWWDARFRDRQLNPMMHEKCLEDDLGYFPKGGKVLDLACGDGRNAIYLAEQGYTVVGVDFCDLALERLRYFSKKRNLNIEVKLMDLSKNYILEDDFDIVIINHYRLKPKLYSIIMNQVKKGGILWVNGFNEIPEDNNDITEVDILRESDFMELAENNLENRKLYQINNREFIRCIWRK